MTKNRGKARREAKEAERKAQLTERFNCLNADGTVKDCVKLLADTIAKSREIRYECTVKEKAFVPHYVTVKAIKQPVFLKLNRHGKPIFTEKLVRFVTIPKLGRDGKPIARPVPTYRDGNPRY